MKATGVVRRIDELGRVVIPKELRRTLRIREGDPLEIFTNKEGELVLKKYSPIIDISDFADCFVESVHKTTGYITMVCDTDSVVAVSGKPKKDFLGKPISNTLDTHLQSAKPVILNRKNNNEMCAVAFDDNTLYNAEVIVPVILGGDLIGCVIMMTQENTVFGDTQLLLCQTIANAIAAQLEL